MIHIGLSVVLYTKFYCFIPIHRIRYCDINATLYLRCPDNELHNNNDHAWCPPAFIELMSHHDAESADLTILSFFVLK